MLFYRPEDLGVRRFFAGGGTFEEEELTRVVEVVHAHGEVAVDALADAADMTAGRVEQALGWLAREGAVRVDPDGRTVRAGTNGDAEDAAAAAAEAAENRRRLDGSRVEMMRAYAEARTCRRRFLLSYLGEDYDRDCEACDVCHAGNGGGDEDRGERPFAVGAPVTHEAFGAGTVAGYEGDKVVVLFEDGGYRTLLAAHVVREGLLRAADG